MPADIICFPSDGTITTVTLQNTNKIVVSNASLICDVAELKFTLLYTNSEDNQIDLIENEQIDIVSFLGTPIVFESPQEPPDFMTMPERIARRYMQQNNLSQECSIAYS